MWLDARAGGADCQVMPPASRHKAAFIYKRLPILGLSRTIAAPEKRPLRCKLALCHKSDAKEYNPWIGNIDCLMRCFVPSLPVLYYELLGATWSKKYMYAVIKSGGKQHRVSEGEVLKLEKIDAATGESIQFDDVLLVASDDDVKIGSPVVEGAAVSAEIISHGRGEKVRIIKFRRRKHSMKRQGHRQWYTEVKITSIALDGAKKKPAAKKAAAAPASGADDLSKISGVGPVLVQKLADLGITTFKQVAEFSADDIINIDEKLNFKGRIERDDWVSQAKELMKGE